VSYSDFKTLEQAIAVFDLVIKNDYYLLAAIPPIILDVRALFKVFYLSGNAFNVNESTSLTGVYDFLLTASSNQVLIAALAVAIVEAKDNNIRSGLRKCAADVGNLTLK
jgi:hypothetical protein